MTVKLCDIEPGFVHRSRDVCDRLVDEHADGQDARRYVRGHGPDGLDGDATRAVRPEHEPEGTGAEVCGELGILRPRNAADFDKELIHGRASFITPASARPGSGVAMNRSPIKNASYPALASARRSAPVVRPLSATAMTSSGISSTASRLTSVFTTSVRRLRLFTPMIDAPASSAMGSSKRS